MATVKLSEYLSADPERLGDALLVNQRQYSIPFNQRPFKWERHHLDSFLGDFRRVLRSGFDENNATEPWKERVKLTGYPHFFGTFIFVENANGLYEVFDGQQRLTAISMFAAALREEVELIAPHIGAERQFLLGSVRSQLSRWLFADPSGSAFRPRVLADTEYKQLFDELIIKNVGSNERERAVDALNIPWKERPDHSRLRSGFSHVRHAVMEMLKGKTEAESLQLVAASLQTLSTLFVCISAHLRSEPFAYQVFQSLNGRGEPLSEVDKIKNELFIRSDMAHHEQVANLWRSAVGASGGRDFGSFLRRRYLGKYGEPCREVDLFRRTCKQELDGGEAKILPVVQSWERDSKVVAALRAGAGFDVSTAYLLKVIFETLRASLAEIALLPAMRKLKHTDPSGFKKVVKAVASFLFRELTIGNRKTNWIEQKLSECGSRIEKGEGHASAISVLETASPNLEFQRNFELAVEARSQIQYYIFYEIEAYLAKSQGSGLVPFPQSPNQHVEHILPKKLPKRSTDWSYWKSKPKRHEQFLNRLGNLMILEAEINIKIRNRGLREKVSGVWQTPKGMKSRKVGYIDSGLQLPKVMSAMKRPGHWTERRIEARQKWLARLAQKVWSIS